MNRSKQLNDINSAGAKETGRTVENYLGKLGGEWSGNLAGMKGAERMQRQMKTTFSKQIP